MSKPTLHRKGKDFKTEISEGKSGIVKEMGRHPFTDKLKSETSVKYLMGIFMGGNNL